MIFLGFANQQAGHSRADRCGDLFFRLVWVRALSNEQGDGCVGGIEPARGVR
jgi:hypothetical protein